MRALPALAALVALACGGGGGETGDPVVEGGPDVPGTARAAAESPGDVPADRAGTFELDGIAHSFLVVQCDLEGRSPTGLLLRGNGTAPDGRRTTVEVERLARGEMVHERATVYFGSIVDGDHWTASRSMWPDGRWFLDPAGDEPAEGPLVRVEGNELVAEGPYRHETEGSSRPGTLRATCPG